MWFLLFNLILCAFSQSGSNTQPAIGLIFTKCITLPTDMPDVICSQPPKEENCTLAPVNYTTGQNMSVMLSSRGFIGFHIALVDKDGKYLYGLFSNQSYARDLKVCGNPPVVSLTSNGTADGKMENVNFTLAGPSDDKVIIRVVLVYERSDANNCSWAAYNFTLYNNNTNSSNNPSPAPGLTPSVAPGVAPSVAPSVIISPSTVPSVAPSVVITPSIAPSVTPSVSVTPSTAPSVAPALEPSVIPTPAPSVVPSTTPGVQPSVAPTVQPTVVPSVAPSIQPSVAPTIVPTVVPTPAPAPN